MIPQRIKKCILHIGTEKTGTTSLQMFLGINRRRLLERGFSVPVSLSPYPVLANHEKLTVIALDRAKLKDDLRVGAKLATIQDVEDYRVRVRENLSRELNELTHQPNLAPSTLLLSNEHCHSRLVTREEVRYLKNFLSEFVEEVRIIVYLRPQHEVAISLFDQALKAGYYDIDVLPNFEGLRSRWVDRIYFEYDALLSRWAEEFGRDNIVVRLYSKRDLGGGGVIQDFMTAIGFDDGEFQLPANENVSLSVECQTVLNAINRYISSQPAVASETLRRHKLVSALASISSGSGIKPKREEAVRFFRSFVGSNEKVRQIFFPASETLFRPEFDSFPVDAPAKVDEIDAAVRVILNLIK
jgi:hypothetical protein